MARSLTQITTIVMQYIDSAMVGARGANASAAIGLVASSTWLFGGLTAAVAAGFYVQVAHQIGAENDAEARNVVRHGLLTALVLSGLLALGGALLSKPLPGLLGGGAELHRDAAAYFLVFALALPFQQLNALCSGFLQCSGDMVTPSILNAVMCALDVAFNTLFIPHYGVLGAGLGTGLACAVISLVMAWRCCFCNAALRLRRKETGRFESEILRKALKIGLPVAVQEAAMCGAQVAATTIIAPLGAVAIAAHSFAVTAESLCYMPGYGIGAAATTLVGRNIGAGKHAEAKRCTACRCALPPAWRVTSAETSRPGCWPRGVRCCGSASFRLRRCSTRSSRSRRRAASPSRPATIPPSITASRSTAQTAAS